MVIAGSADQRLADPRLLPGCFQERVLDVAAGVVQVIPAEQQHQVMGFGSAAQDLGGLLAVLLPLLTLAVEQGALLGVIFDAMDDQ